MALCLETGFAFGLVANFTAIASAFEFHDRAPAKKVHFSTS
jgi:hypothetical protein